MTTAEWRKSRRSEDDGGHCVELAALPGTIGIRDSKNPHGRHLVLNPNDFRTLLAQLKEH